MSVRFCLRELRECRQELEHAIAADELAGRKAALRFAEDAAGDRSQIEVAPASPSRVISSVSTAAATQRRRPLSVQDIIDRRRHWVSFERAAGPPPLPPNYDVLGENYESIDIIEDTEILGPPPARSEDDDDDALAVSPRDEMMPSPPARRHRRCKSAAPLLLARPASTPLRGMVATGIARATIREQRAQRLDVAMMRQELTKHALQDRLRDAEVDRAVLERARARTAAVPLRRALHAAAEVSELHQGAQAIDADLRNEVAAAREALRAEKAAAAAAERHAKRTFAPRLQSPWTSYGATLRPLVASAGIASCGSRGGARRRPATAVSQLAFAEAAAVPVDVPPAADALARERALAASRTSLEIASCRAKAVARCEAELEPSARAHVASFEAANRRTLAELRALNCVAEPAARAAVAREEGTAWRHIVAIRHGERDAVWLRMWLPELHRDRARHARREQERAAARAVVADEGRQLLRDVSAAHQEKVRSEWRQKWEQQQHDRQRLLELQQQRSQLRAQLITMASQLRHTSIEQSPAPLDSEASRRATPSGNTSREASSVAREDATLRALLDRGLGTEAAETTTTRLAQRVEYVQWALDGVEQKIDDLRKALRDG